MSDDISIWAQCHQWSRPEDVRHLDRAWMHAVLRWMQLAIAMEVTRQAPQWDPRVLLPMAPGDRLGPGPVDLAERARQLEAGCPPGAWARPIVELIVDAAQSENRRAARLRDLTSCSFALVSNAEHALLMAIRAVLRGDWAGARRAARWARHAAVSPPWGLAAELILWRIDFLERGWDVQEPPWSPDSVLACGYRLFWALGRGDEALAREAALRIESSGWQDTGVWTSCAGSTPRILAPPAPGNGVGCGEELPATAHAASPGAFGRNARIPEPFSPIARVTQVRVGRSSHWRSRMGRAPGVVMGSSDDSGPALAYDRGIGPGAVSGMALMQWWVLRCGDP
ncbi:MAG: hypothetical protein R3F17_14850 [Planctomycetota bacterium]